MVILLGTGAACSSGAEDAGGATTSSAAGDAQAPDAASDEAASAERPQSTNDRSGAGVVTAKAARFPAQSRQVISTGSVRVEAADLDSARQELDRLLGRFGGYVADEKTVTDAKGRTETSRLTLRLPSARFDQLMAAFGEIGTVADTSRRAEDVTTEVIDVASRIRTQEVSLQRLRGFLGRATNVDTIIRLESEIARREADLASMRSQRDYLADQTSLATISVELFRTAGPSPTDPDDPLAGAGFLSGLSNGWQALRGALILSATVLGAVAPFALVGALFGLPVLWWSRAARRRRRQNQAAQAAQASATG